MKGRKMENAIVMKNVCKDFKILNRHEGLKGSIRDLFSRDYKTISAVKDVSLEIAKGEIIGYRCPRADIRRDHGERPRAV